MTDPYTKTCDEVRLNLYLDGELGDNETQWMDAHLKDCTVCRQKAKTIVAFTHAFRQRVKDSADLIDFKILEKEVLKKTLPRYVPRSIFGNILDALKFLGPIAIIAGFLIFFIYTRYIADSAPAPSAIIDSFTGNVESLMIFETESQETILWYNEKTDPESERDAL